MSATINATGIHGGEREKREAGVSRDVCLEEGVTAPEPRWTRKAW